MNRTGRGIKLLITCEHGGREIPAAHRSLFAEIPEIVAGHRGWDPGALELARRLARGCAAPLMFSTVTRLLVELNRSLHHRSLFSTYVQSLDAAARRAVLDAHYHPHRKRVESWIAEAEPGVAVVHISVHSFTPDLDGTTRRADVGWLYDPGRPRERSFVNAWRSALAAAAPDLLLRRNYPYLGTADGFTTHLRRRFPNERYAGIELEINQRFPLGDMAKWRRLQRLLTQSLRTACSRTGESL